DKDSCCPFKFTRDCCLHDARLPVIKLHHFRSVQVQKYGNAAETRKLSEQRFAPKTTSRGHMDMYELDATGGEETRKFSKRLKKQHLTPNERTVRIGLNEMNIIRRHESCIDVALHDALHAATCCVPDQHLHQQQFLRRIGVSVCRHAGLARCRSEMDRWLGLQDSGVPAGSARAARPAWLANEAPALSERMSRKSL